MPPPPPPPPIKLEEHTDEALGRMLRLAEGNTLLLLSTVTGVSEACMSLAKRLKTLIDKDKNITLRDGMLVMTRWSNLVQKGVDAARDMGEIKRNLLGDAAMRSEAASAGRNANEPRPPTPLEAALAELACPGGAYRLAAARNGVDIPDAEFEDVAEPVART